MSSHSEEVWESFDALWRRIKQLSHEIRELEARLAAVEDTGNVSEKLSRVIPFEGEIHR